MSETISAPWIASYLLEVAKKYGGDLLSVPPEPPKGSKSKGKKAQIIKFLTQHNPDTDQWVWAFISDKRDAIPVRFSKAAIKAYEKHPRFENSLLHSHGTALIRVSDYKAAFMKVPLKIGGKGMSDKPRLAMEVGHFDVLGSFGESPWGKPVDVQKRDPDIALWASGLAGQSGGGNVLKQQEEERRRQENAKPSTSAQPVQQTLKRKGQVARKTVTDMRRKPPTETTQPHPPKEREPERLVRQRFKKVSTNPKGRLAADDILEAVQEAPLITETDGPQSRSSSPNQVSPIRRPRKRNALEMSPSCSPAPRTPRKPRIGATGPSTPSVWEASQRGSVAPMDLDDPQGTPEGQNVKMEEHDQSPTRTNNHSDGYSERITPIKSPPPSSLPVPPPESSPIPSQRREHPLRFQSMPPPASPQSQRSLVHPSSSLPPSSISLPGFKVPKLPRRVGDGDLSIHPDLSGIGRILVPNSDSSGSQRSQLLTQTQSQSHSQSQPRSQSQSQPQSQSQSQCQGPSSHSLSYVTYSQGSGKAAAPLQSQSVVTPPHQVEVRDSSPKVDPSAQDAEGKPPSPTFPKNQGLPSITISHSPTRRSEQPMLSPTVSQLIQPLPTSASTVEHEADGDDAGTDGMDEFSHGGDGPDAPESESSSEEEMDQLDSDDAKTHAMVLASQRQSRSPELRDSRSPSVQPSVKLGGDSHSYESRLPAQPTSPDVFLTEESFKQPSPDPEPTPESPPITQSFLGGLSLNLEMKQEDGVPPVTWDILSDILKQVGRARYKQKKQRILAGG
ncbi:hypothetical protein K474DRAFT_1776144 [Panus rudis PR-1116 ss-1]|nr:hypothetical protein K474DRAFT_1776144 [Panus rudis PR-1116 ss-1]